ncbi:unnamed protein product [Adineta steineri]|uniref:G-protein coupled receptors family 1 profile domain-containing protein n=1 Tax=Adineta steineri TaxID=433720 RepID=A0A814SR26_9BILA|nr:unnamed protein product [Adineta steineri]CAF1149300.1 unnamed protein product [Adineta steineri]CAF1151072.1 unnamed protein product [Adineta steineri]
MSTNPCLSNVNGSIRFDTLHDIEVAGYRYVMLTICIFGVVCNILNLCVLLQRRLKESPYTYLTGLALADMLTLMSISPVSIVRGDYIRHETIFFTLTRLEAQLYMPLANYFGQVSIMITVALTVERYLFTTYPLRAQGFCKASYARRVVATIVVICGILNIPRFLTETVEKLIAPESTFVSSKCITHPFKIEYSSINSSHIGECFCVVGNTKESFLPFKNYYYYTMLGINQILPFAILLYLNLRLIRRVQISNRYTLAELIARQHSPMNSSAPTMNSATQKRLREEHRLTKTLVAVVIVFLICNTFTIISYPGLVRLVTKHKYPKYFYVGFRIQKLITNIMLLLNYSINFFFYCAFNEKFLFTLKKTFRYDKLFCGLISSHNRSLSSSSTMNLHSNILKANQCISSYHNGSDQINRRRKHYSNSRDFKKISRDELITNEDL